MQYASPRHLSRILTVQAIYYYRINQATFTEINEFLIFYDNELFHKANLELMNFLIQDATINFDNNLLRYQQYLTKEVATVDIIEQIILSIAATELLHNLTVPATVIIDEAIKLAKLYGSDESFKFINSLVDRLAHEVRSNELITHHATK